MNLLAILVREMRALCRKRGTYWARIALAIPVLLTGALFFLQNNVQGSEAMTAQAVVCQIFFAFGAAFAASDAISSEKREGTLGLLLLTPLRSYQVLLGKLLTRISQFLLCLWAVVPILALPLLAGGVGLADMAKLVAGILAGCLLGMAIGLCASVACRSAVTSAWISFSALLACYILPMLAATIVALAAIVVVARTFGYAIMAMLNGLLFASVVLFDLFFLWMGPYSVTGFALDLDAPKGLGSWALNMVVLGGLDLFLLLFTMLLFSFLWTVEREEGETPHGRILQNRESAPETVTPRPPIGDLENPARILHARCHRSGLPYRICTGILLLLGLLAFLVLCLQILAGGASRRSDFGSLPYLYLVGLPLVAMAYLRASLDAPSLLQESRKTGMLELLMIAPLSRMDTFRGLEHPVIMQLIWNGFLILAWHILAILAWGVLWLGREDKPGDLLDGPWLLHMGCVLTLPFELLSIRSFGMWGGLKTEHPLRIALLVFLIHFVGPVVSLPVILILIDEFSELSIEGGLIPWHLLRLAVSVPLWIWCSTRMRAVIADEPPLRTPPS